MAGNKFMDANIECFGGYPYCGGYDGILNIEREHWGICRRHQAKWHIGSNLFSGWRDMTEDQWLRDSYELSGYRQVEPIFPASLANPVNGDSAKIISFPSKGRAGSMGSDDPEAA